MLYTSGNKSFKHHVHPNLQRRIRIFLIIGGISLIVVGVDIYQGAISIPLALISVAIGAVVGWVTSRIFHLSWSHDGQQVISRIDHIGWIILAGYIIFELGRAAIFQNVIQTGSDSTAITFAFVSAALLSRMLGLRGRILKILKDEKIFG